jgi:hypothetical protein
MFPIGRWMKEPLAPVLSGFARRSRLVADGVLNGGVIHRLMAEHMADRADHHVRLWMLLNAEIWYRMHDAGWSETTVDGLLEDVAGVSHVR